jgi:hypothetical protein
MAEHPGAKKRHFLTEVRESLALLGRRMEGKTVLFAVDDSDHRSESLVMRLSVFEKAGAGEGSGVIRYSEFFSGATFRADALILRSSRLFPVKMAELRGALESFRSGNPKAAVILCLFDGEVFQKALPMLESGLVNAIDTMPPNDFELLRKASDIIGRLGPQ